MLKNINLRSGKITYDGFYIDFDLPLEEQELILQQDMVQIQFPQRYVVDVGWYPMMDANGICKIVVIKNSDWDNPILERVISADQIKTFYQQLDEVIQFVEDKAGKNKA